MTAIEASASPPELPSTAPLVGLRDRIAKARAARFVDLDVPGVEGVFVRYLPLSGEAIANTWSADPGGKRRDMSVMERHALTLVDACAGIFERQSDGTARSVHPDYDGAITEDGRLVGEPIKFYAISASCCSVSGPT